MTDPLYIYDFDSTLFPTSVIWEEWINRLRHLGLPTKRILQKATTAVNTGFTPMKHAAYLGLERSRVVALKSDYCSFLAKRCRHLVYADVRQFLKKVPPSRQIIMTRGDRSFQNFKIQASRLSSYVSNIIVAEPPETKTDKLREIVAIARQEVILIDDNPDELESIALMGWSIKLVRIIRPGEPYGIPHQSDGVKWSAIECFEELKNIP